MDLIPERTFFTSASSGLSAFMNLLASARGQEPRVMSTTSEALLWRPEKAGMFSWPMGSAADASNGKARVASKRRRRDMRVSWHGPAREAGLCRRIRKGLGRRVQEGLRGGTATLPYTYICVTVIGRDGEIRTRDPLHPMQVRYQAAPRPDCGARILSSQTMTCNS